MITIFSLCLLSWETMKKTRPEQLTKKKTKKNSEQKRCPIKFGRNFMGLVEGEMPWDAQILQRFNVFLYFFKNPLRWKLMRVRGMELATHVTTIKPRVLQFPCSLAAARVRVSLKAITHWGSREKYKLYS